MTQELRRLAEAATQGPWIAAGPSYGDPMPRYYNAVVTDTDGPIEDEDICSNTMTSEDALYIAAANPAAILSLLDRLEKAEKDAFRLVWAMNWMRMSIHDQGFAKHVLERGGTGDYSDCVTYIDAAMEASK